MRAAVFAIRAFIIIEVGSIAVALRGLVDKSSVIPEVARCRAPPQALFCRLLRQAENVKSRFAQKFG
jgi:hypothetical protein